MDQRSVLGGDGGDRTHDLLTASQTLSQLSYAPVTMTIIRDTTGNVKHFFEKNFLEEGLAICKKLC